MSLKEQRLNFITKISKKRRWDFGDSNNSNLLSPNNTYSSAGDYSVQLVSTISATGCFDTKVIHRWVISIDPDQN